MNEEEEEQGGGEGFSLKVLLIVAVCWQNLFPETHPHTAEWNKALTSEGSRVPLY